MNPGFIAISAIRWRLTALVLGGALAFGIVSQSRAAEVFVRIAPPAPQSVAVVGVAPSPRHVWIGGYYTWVGGRYVWTGGRWVVPPRAGVVWVSPRWVARNGGWVYVAGRWR